MNTTERLEKDKALKADLNAARDAYRAACNAYDAASEAKEVAWDALLVANKALKEGAPQ